MPKKILCFSLLSTVICLLPLLTSEISVSARQATPLAICEFTATPIGSEPSTPVTSPAASPSPATTEFDQLYLDLMIVQQNRLIETARVGTLRADNQVLQRLAADIVTSSESMLELLRELRIQMFDTALLPTGPELMREFDEISRDQPGAGGVPGAMEIVAGNNILDLVCASQYDLDRTLVTALIEHLDAGIVLSSVANDLAKQNETKAIAQHIVKTDRPFEDGAIAIRDGILDATPGATPTGGGL